MKTISNGLLSNCHYIFFSIYFLIGFSIYKDYGFNIDETFQRRSGLYWLEYLFNFFDLEKLSLIANEKLLSSSNFTEPWSDVYGIIFDVPAALIEIIFSLNKPIQMYEMRHFLTFFYFYIGIIFFYKTLLLRFNNKFLSLAGCFLLIFTPRIFGDSFQNNKDLVFLTFFIISTFYIFKTFENFNIKNIFLLAIFSSIATSTRLFGLIFPFTFIFIYFLSILSNKDDLKNINKIFIFIFLYILFLLLHWPYLWISPLEKLSYLLNNLQTFGPSLVYFNDVFYNTELVPFHYLPLWIFISTPVINLILFLSGLFLLSKVFILKLFSIEKSKSNYDFWNNNNEKKDFFIFITFIIFSVIGIFFATKHYNSWRIFYFLNFFIIYFAIYFLNLIFIVPKFKKYINILIVVLSITSLFNIYKIYVYHPYQSLYFNELLSNKFKNKFEIDFTGLSGIKFLREVVMSDKSNEIKIGINSWYPLWRMKELLPEIEEKRVVFVYDDIKNADYVYSNKIFNVNVKLSDKFSLDDTFTLYKQHFVDGILIYEVHKKIK